VLLTKSDKLNHAEAQKALSIARLQSGGGEARLFSALKKKGLDEVAQMLWDWTHDGSTVTTAPATAPEDEPPALD
ncbi:MAG: YihA family ribosome biogenesis GTP-binding protein, partial [Hydrogenophaga sp.]|nr:YihA family ribosome biogenesis GTP-binding protein [Hydrogenophaga sp.]